MSDLLSLIVTLLIIVIVIVFILMITQNLNSKGIFYMACIAVVFLLIITALFSCSPKKDDNNTECNLVTHEDTLGTPQNNSVRCFSRPTCSASQTSPSKVLADAKASVAPLPEIYPSSPQQIGSVYLGSGAVPFDGTGKRIGIIGCFYYPNLQADFNIFCNEFGQKSKQLQIHQYGTTTNSGWATELCLDTQWCNVFAPNATIHVFMAQDDSFSSILIALKNAALAGMDVISMSFGGDESASVINDFEPVFSSYPNILFLASSGDSDTVSYPSSSPNVISVGGTILSVASNGLDESSGPIVNKTAIRAGAYTKLAESDWYTPDGNGSGHGTSGYFPKPAYQAAHNPGGYRSTPDLSLIAATPGDMGVFIYCSAAGGWLGVQGTSLSCPSLAGMLATVNSRRKTPVTRAQVLTYLYSLASASLPIDVMVDGAGYINGRTVQALVSI